MTSGKPKRPYQKLPPESERPLGPTGQPLSATEMYAQRSAEKLPPPEPLPMEKVAELRKRIADIQAEMSGLQTNVKLLPDDHPLRRQAQMRIELLTANMEKASTQLKTAEAEAEKPATVNELRRLNSTLEAAMRDLNARLRSVEQRTIATPAEITDAAKELTAGLKRLQALESQFDADVKDATERQQKFGQPEPEVQPKAFRIAPSYSPLSGRIIAFVVQDPEGRTSKKRKQYEDAIAKEYSEVDPERLADAQVHHTEYTVTFTLKEKGPRPAAASQWWTIASGGSAVAVNGYYEPPATDVKRFWAIYHSTPFAHMNEDIEAMKADIMERAEKMALETKPNRRDNLDRYFYAFYQVHVSKLLDWFFKTVFEEKYE